MDVTEAVALADEYWSYYRNSAQMWNIDRGDVDQIEFWEDYSAVGVAARLATLHQFENRVAVGTAIPHGSTNVDRLPATSSCAGCARSPALEEVVSVFRLVGLPTPEVNRGHARTT